MIWTIKWNDLMYLILELSCIHNSGTFTVCGPQAQFTLAWVGEDVPLSCHLSPKMDAQGMTVKWVRGPLVVHLYRSGQEVEEVQAPAFQGRTKMLRQDMAEGKVTLSIHQVQLSDAGQYTCYFQAGPLYSEASFDLLVAECQKEQFSVTDPTQLIQAKQGENITISCELSTKKDGQDMTVNSFRNQTLVHRYPSRENLEESQRVEFQRRMELLKHDMAEGKVTLRIHQVQVSDAGPYTCYFHSSSYHSEAHIELQVAENRPTSQKRVKIIVPVSSVVFIGVLLVLGICFFYQRNLQRHRAKDSQSGQSQEEDRETEGIRREPHTSPEDLQLPKGLPTISPLEKQEGEDGAAPIPEVGDRAAPPLGENSRIP